MARQANSQDVVSSLDSMTDEQIEAAANELHNFVAHRRNASKAGAQRAPFNAGKFFQNLLQILQALAPVLGSLGGAQPGTPPQQGNP
jgi:hypothetical protein